MATTENMRVLTDQKTSTVASNVQGVQQARRLADAQTASPTVRHQRSVQADPNKLSKSLESISNAVGNIAQDTYALNDALVDEMVSDDNAMMAAGLDELDNSLKPGESRSNIIKIASTYRAELMAKKGNFDGNADMQARYKEKFVDPSAHKTMSYIKRWQDQEHQINYGKLKEEFREWQTAEAPLLLKGLSGQPLLDAQNEIRNKFNKYTNELAAYGDMSKTDARLLGSKRMTDNLFSDFDGNHNKYVGAGKSAFISVEGKVDSEKLAAFLDDKYYIYGDFKSDGKGWVTTEFKTDDMAVRREITSALNSLKTSAESAASGVKKDHAKFYNNVSTAVSTPGAEERTHTYGNHTFTTKYMDPRDGQAYANQQYEMVYGYPPSLETQSIWMEKTAKSSNELQQDKFADLYIKNIRITVDRTKISKEAAKPIYEQRSRRILTAYNTAVDIFADENASPFERLEAQENINFVNSMLSNNEYQNEMSLVVEQIHAEVFTNPTSVSSAEAYKKYGRMIESSSGQQYLRSAAGSVKEYNKNLLYSALYKSYDKDKPFSIPTELAGRINALADGRLTKAEIEIIQGYSLREDTFNGNKYMTYEEKENQLLLNKTRLLLAPDRSIDYKKNDFGSDPYFAKNEHANIVGVKPTTNGSGAPAPFVGIMNQSLDSDSKFKYYDNLESKVINDLVVMGADKEALDAINEGFILQEIEGRPGKFYIYSAKSMMRMSPILNLLEWDGAKLENPKMPKAKELRENEFFKNRHILRD